jgi:hypothetical protein
MHSFYFSIIKPEYDNSLDNKYLVAFTPAPYWQKNKELPEILSEEEFDFIEDIANDLSLIEVMESVYETTDPFVDEQEMIYHLEDKGFESNIDFDDYVENKLIHF